MTEQALDLRWSAGVVTRRWRMLAIAGAAGCALGVLYGAVSPPRLESTALVLLPESVAASSSAQDGTAAATQVAIARSTVVLERAGHALRPARSGQGVLSDLEVSSPTAQLLQITGLGSGAAARALAQAVAEAYVRTVQENATSISAATMSDLRSREADLTKQFKALQTELEATAARRRATDPASADGRREAQLGAQLEAEQSDISLQLDKVKDAVTTGESLGGASQAATSIIQPASPAVGAGRVRRSVQDGLEGLLLAAVGAGLVALVAARRDPRLRTRDDLADAVGSPVLAAVRSRPQGSLAAWTAFLDTYRADPVEEWAFRQVLKALATPPSVTVVSFAGDPAGLALGPQLALFAVTIGLRTRLEPVTGQAEAPALWAACGAADRFGPPDRPADLVVRSAVADRGTPSLRELPPSAATLVAISPGTASAADLARLAVELDDCGRRIDGIVVADPDPADRTTGRRPPDERARLVELPHRLTGVAPLGRRTGPRGSGDHG